MTYANRAWERLAGDPRWTCAGACSGPNCTEDRDPVESDFSRLINGRLDSLAREARLISATAVCTGWTCEPSVRARRRRGDRRAGHAARNHAAQEGRGIGDGRAGRPTTLLANFPGMVYRAATTPIGRWISSATEAGADRLRAVRTGEKRPHFVRTVDPSEDREFVRQQVESNLALRKPFGMTYRIVDAQGKESWVWEQGCGVFSSTGEVLALEGFITGVRMRASADQQALRRLGIQPAPARPTSRICARPLVRAASFGRRRYPCALFWIDIDDFERARDQLGRARGSGGRAAGRPDRRRAGSRHHRRVARLRSIRSAADRFSARRRPASGARGQGDHAGMLEHRRLAGACGRLAAIARRRPWSPTASIGSPSAMRVTKAPT